MAERRTPVDPYSVQAWIREREAGFFNAWKEHALAIAKRDQEFVGLGFEHIPQAEGEIGKIFTGRGMCLGAVLVFGHCIRKKFGPETYLEIVDGEVRSPNRLVTVSRHNLEPVNNSILLTHNWFRFLGPDRRRYFVDPSYGQVDLRVNRVVLDRVTRERSYYGYYGKLIVEPLEQPVFDETDLSHYQKVIEALLD